MIWNFIIDQIPWYVQTGFLAVVALAVLYMCVRIFGWERVRSWIAPVLAVLAAIGLLQRSRQQGYADRQAQEKQAEDKAIKTVDTQRADTQAMSDEKLDSEVDKWSRP